MIRSRGSALIKAPSFFAARHNVTTIDLETALPWSQPKRVETKLGPRILRKAAPTESFAALLKANKEALKAVGIGWSKDVRTGAWEIVWWQPVPAEEIKAREVAIEASRAVDAGVALPCPEGRAYLGYQRAGIAFALGRQGTLIADEMGLGKTIQAIGVINADTAIHRVLVICPATLKLNWHRELKSWLTRELTIGIAESTVFPSTDIVIINPDILVKFPKRLEFFWDLVIVDESHLFKNPKAKRTRALVGHKPSRKQIDAGEKQTSGIPARKKLALTGTPILNRPIEVFPILNWLDSSTWPSFWKFATRYAAAHENGYGWDLSGASNLGELQDKMRASVMIRRLKKDVLTELPPKRRQIIEIPSGECSGLVTEQNDLDRKHEPVITALEVRAELAKASDNAQEYEDAVAALQQARSVAFTEGARVAHEIALAKVPFTVDYLSDAIESGQKVVIFAHHLDAIAQLRSAFPKSVVVTGEVTPADRQAAVDRFQSDPECTPFIGGIKAAGVGLTLTASSYVVFHELDWVPANMSQCEDRCHRIGQHDNVVVHHLVLEGSLDARKARVIVEKQAIADQALDRVTERPAQPEPSPKSIALAPIEVSREQIAAEAETMTQEQIKAVHQGLRMLAGMCDGARELDEMGFNKVDARIGHALAEQSYLSARQAALGRKLVNKYRRQLPADLVEQTKNSTKT